MMKFFSFLCVFGSIFLNHFRAEAQTTKTLQTPDFSLLKQTKDLERIAISLEDQYLFDSAAIYHAQYIRLIKDHLEKGLPRDSAMSKAFVNLAYMSNTMHENRKALAYTDSAISLVKNSHYTWLYLKALNTKSVALISLTEYEKSIEILIEILKTTEANPEQRDLKGFKLSALINIGKNYIGLGNWDKAIEYTRLANSLDSVDRKNKAIIALNLSAAFVHKSLPDSVVTYAAIARDIGQELQNDQIIVFALTNLASANETLGKYQEALSQTDDLLVKAKKTKNISGYATGLALKGNLLGHMNQYDQAIEAFTEAIEYATQYEDYEYMAAYYESISEVYARKKDFDNAYKFYALYDQINDTIRSKNEQKAYNDILVKYETAQKEEEIANQKLDLASKEVAIRSQRLQIFGLVGGLLIFVLFTIIYYNRYRSKQKQRLQAAIFEEKEKGFERIISATEEERQRISKDLHDGIGQQLSALKMALAKVSSSTADENQREDLELITEQFSKSANEVRQISHQMMPRTLMENGLVEAIEDLLTGSFQFSDIKYQFEHHKVSERFDQRIEISLYRVLQELVNNIIKHSGASEVMVQLIRNKEKLVLFVEDNGKGMKDTSKGGHGLLNIKSRLDMVQGSVNYEPSMKSGTSATISIPIS